MSSDNGSKEKGRGHARTGGSLDVSDLEPTALHVSSDSHPSIVTGGEDVTEKLATERAGLHDQPTVVSPTTVLVFRPPNEDPQIPILLAHDEAPPATFTLRAPRGLSISTLDELRRSVASEEEAFGPFTLFGQVGAGGMAEVRLAVQKMPDGTERSCVVKRIAKGREADFREMFVEEARISRLLTHPNIVQLYDSGEIEGRLFLAMELIDGITLRHLDQLASFVQIPSPALLEVGIQVANALTYAHELEEDGRPLKLVHRDVSPQNIIISRNGEVKLLDFGIARFRGRQHQTQHGLVKGKARYMAPEYVQTRDLDTRVDIYALGILLAESIGNRGEVDQGLKNPLALEEAVRRACNDPQRAPEPLVELLVRMTSQKPDRRPDTAMQVEQELQAILEKHFAREASEQPLASYVTDAVFARLTPYQSVANQEIFGTEKLSEEEKEEDSDLSFEAVEYSGPLYEAPDDTVGVEVTPALPEERLVVEVTPDPTRPLKRVIVLMAVLIVLLVLMVLYQSLGIEPHF